MNIKLLAGVFAVIGMMSCSSIKKIAVPPGSPEVVKAVAKKVDLTADELDRWSYFDLEKDSIPGMNLYQAYEFLKGKKSTPVVVAVADTGMDLDHEDLKDVIWTNPKEIAGNGIDDDKNGFVDDMHGWNFLGDIYDETLESTRMVRMGKVKFGNKTLSDIDPKDKAEFQLFKRLEKEVAEEAATSSNKHYFNVDHDPRAAYDKHAYNYDVKIYGNNKVGNTIPGESHSSHVAGIIGATRNNNTGIDGIADNVKLMAVRVVPNGDEYDKDVALGIRYAVDNGAKIINCSFGKKYSPNSEWVYDALKYAAKKDVLVVNAAMNNAENLDVEKGFPGDAPNLKQEICNNLLTVGANNYTYNEKLVAWFSNYGEINVDVFAPGVKINSTVPESKYAKYNGTSMASPSAAGVAALIRSYYPELSANQVKQIIMNSGNKVDITVEVPGTKGAKKRSFSKMSKTGRIVNAYKALKMADAMVNKRKRKK